ncbi:MAG: hypothetical protein MUO76_07900 [Anaerolineaceae bacterium]|nr:hypothetical protein [Anaerolineaceae bacterium]
MMENTYTFCKMMQFNMQAAERSYAQGRLTKQARVGKPGIGSQVLAKAAQGLIAAGESLKALAGQETALNL